MQPLLSQRDPPPPDSAWNEAAEIVLRAAEELHDDETVVCVNRFLYGAGTLRPESLVQCWRALDGKSR